MPLLAFLLLQFHFFSLITSYSSLSLACCLHFVHISKKAGTTCGAFSQRIRPRIIFYDKFFCVEMYRVNLSPIPHYLAISYLFSHSSSIFSQPGCQAATSCATLYQSHQYLELSAMTCVELQKTNFASSVLILVGWWYDYLFFPIWFDMVSNVLNVMKSLRNLSESNEFETNARADVKYQYETFKYSSKSPATTRFIQIYVHLRLLFNTTPDCTFNLNWAFLPPGSIQPHPLRDICRMKVSQTESVLFGKKEGK